MLLRYYYEIFEKFGTMLLFYIGQIVQRVSDHCNSQWLGITATHGQKVGPYRIPQGSFKCANQVFFCIPTLMKWTLRKCNLEIKFFVHYWKKSTTRKAVFYCTIIVFCLCICVSVKYRQFNFIFHFGVNGIL